MHKVKLKLSLKVIYYFIIFCFMLNISSSILFVNNMNRYELSISENVEVLDDGSLYCTVKLINNTDKVVGNVTVEHLIPSGYALGDNEERAFISDKLDSGEDVNFSYLLHKINNATDSDFVDTRSVKLYNFIIILSILLIIFVLISAYVYKKKYYKLLVVILLLSLYILNTLVNIVKQSEVDKSVFSEHMYTFNHGINERITFTEYMGQNYLDKWNDRFPDGVVTYVNNIKDTDGDGLTDYEELCVTFTNQFSKYTNNYISDAEWDRDGDGVSNYDEVLNNTNPLVNNKHINLNNGEKEIVGTLYCVSFMPTDLYNMGHSCLFFKADTDIILDTSDIYVGNGISVLPYGTMVELSAGDYASFGNFITTQQIADVEYSGVFCNADVYSIDDYFKDVNYLKVVNMPVTEYGMNAVLNYFRTHHWYNLYTNNCTTMAYGAWNEAAKADGNTDRLLTGSLYKWLWIMRVSELSPLRFIYQNMGYNFAYKRKVDVPLCLCFDMLSDNTVSNGEELYADLSAWIADGGLH